MSHSSVDHQLDLLEQQFKEVSVAVAEGDAASLQSGSATLQQLAVHFVQMMDGVEPGGLGASNRASRIKALAQSFPALRENLLRRSAYVEQALQLVVPTAPKATYADHSRYGNGARQAGAFTTALSA